MKEKINKTKNWQKKEKIEERKEWNKRIKENMWNKT